MKARAEHRLAWHVSPSANRDSIGRLGLRYADLGPGISPYDGRPIIISRATVFEIAGQPRGTYLAHTLDGAEQYARHIWRRFQPRPGARLFELDVWQVRLPPGLEGLPDEDWYTPASCVQADIAPERLTWLRAVTPQRPA